MKIIEAMKDIKRLEEKCGDLQTKIANYCADLDVENPTYPDQKAMVTGWLQGVHDSLNEAMRLKIAIQKTNLQTIVPIELGGVKVEKSIAQWIIRRRTYAVLEQMAWSKLTNKKLQEGVGQKTDGTQFPVKIRLYFDPVLRDSKIEEYRSEPSIIDRTLEVVNATTDIIE